MSFFVRLLILVLLICGGGRAFSAEVPRIRLDESERQFMRAYACFLNRDYWSALDYLDRALKVNTYMVDYYLLRGLIMDRIGELSEGRKSLSYYLEVRPRDAAMPRILSHVIGLERDSRALIGMTPLPVRWRVVPLDLQNEMKLGSFRPFSVAGLGKADSFGDSLFLSDTLGDRVYFVKISDGDERERIRRISVQSPVAVLPMGDGSFRIVSDRGDVHSFTDSSSGPLSPDVVGNVDRTVTDATLLSGRLFAAADPVRREVGFYSPVTLEDSGSWAPPEQVMLFEPVALSAYGSWLAVADRGNERIFFVNVAERGDFFSLDIPRPRDVVWSPLGELFVVSENESLYRVLVNFRDRQAEVSDGVEKGIAGGWTLFGSPGGDVYCLDITGSRLWKALPAPGVDAAPGFLSVFRPMVLHEKDRESFVLEATLMSPFASALEDAVPVVHAVWNNRLISSSAIWKKSGKGEEKGEIFVFHRPGAVGEINPALGNMVVENGTDIRIALPSVWAAGKETLTNIVIDSTIDFSQEELDAAVFFCLNNGIQLDLWARALPEVEMVRAAALSGGRVLFSLAGAPDLNPPRSKMQVFIPLPADLASSGYPGRSMLTVYLDIGLMQTRDWIPLWADLLDQ
ncbi:MAG: hypothetical protein LBR61_10825 [Synergistaceae bacterium]|nr:hypothetical protein [Synergistaceae bacterium]